MFFTIEHRYYGASQPFKDWSTPNLKNLTAEDALADMADFIDDMNTQIIAKWKGTNRKWVTVGGSYAGALSAWFQAAYPDKKPLYPGFCRCDSPNQEFYRLRHGYLLDDKPFGARLPQSYIGYDYIHRRCAWQRQGCRLWLLGFYICHQDHWLRGLYLIHCWHIRYWSVVWEQESALCDIN